MYSPHFEFWNIKVPLCDLITVLTHSKRLTWCLSLQKLMQTSGASKPRQHLLKPNQVYQWTETLVKYKRIFKMYQ